MEEKAMEYTSKSPKHPSLFTKLQSATSLMISAICSLFLVSSCSKNDLNKTGQKSRKLNLYFQADVLSMDPRIGFERRTVQVLRELFEGLTRLSKDGTPELALAQSVSISDDKTVYTFHLRPSKWSDGSAVTADDFIWAWKSVLSREVPSSAAFVLFIIKNARQAFLNECSLDEVGIKALDPLTLKITLEHPAPFFLELLTLPICSPVCKAFVTNNPNWASEAFPTYVCNGPYLLKERKVKSHLTLEKNPLYWNAEGAGADSLSISIIEDPQTAFNMFEEKTLDWYGDPCGTMSLEMVSELNQKGVLSTKESGGVHSLVCNTKTSHIASPKIRKALAYALNRNEICNSLLQGGETPAYSIIHRTFTRLQAKPFEESGTAARALFEEGLKELGLTRQTFPPITITYFSEPTVKSVVEIEQQQLQENLGIRIELNAVDWSTFAKKFYSGEFEIISSILFTPYSDPSYTLETLKYKSSGANATGWEHPEYIRLLDLSNMSTDNEVRDGYLREAETFVMDHMPMIPVFYHTFKYTKAPHVEGEALSPAGQMELKWLTKQP